MDSEFSAAIPELADAAFDAAVDTRRAIHAQPELAFLEARTTELVRQRLGALGLRELPCPTDTGAVFALDGGRPGRSVLLRADIDALPVTEEVEVGFRSRIEGQMHACGHDAHTAILLATAEAMASRAESLPGNYVFLFQPGEEFGFGARKMIDGGVLDGFAADRCISLHVASPLPAGLVGVRAGVQNSRAQQFRVGLSGTGGHAAMAGSDGNVVLAVAALAGRLPGVVEDLEYDYIGCACSAGVIRAGTASNVVPRQASLEGTFRTFTDEQFDTASGRLRELCAAVEAEFLVRADLQLQMVIPEVVNDPAAVGIFRAAAARVIGAASVIDVPPVQPSDDISEFLRRIPGVYYLVGARPGTGVPPMHHAPDFDIDEESLRVGTSTMLAGAVALATSPGDPGQP